MGQVITTGSYPRLLLGDITTIFGAHYNELKAVHPRVYRKKASEKNYEEAIQLGGLGLANELGEGSAIEVDGTSQGYARRTTHKVWHKALKMTMQAIADNRHLDLAKEGARMMARSLNAAKEFNAAALFNNATSTSAPYVGADGVALLSASHPTHAGGTFSNLASTDLTELAVENAATTIAGWVDNGGILMNASIKALMIPAASRFEAHRILKSNLRYATADNDANAVKDLGVVPEIIQWNYLTDTDSWFLLTDQEGLVFYERARPEAHHEQEPLTMAQIYMMHERYSFDHYDPRCVLGSMGA